MNKKEIIKKIELNKDKLKEKGVKKIGLFGSFAKNKQNKKSDIDILVKLNNVSFDNYADLLIILENLLKRKIDLVLENKLRPELKYVKKEAQYARI